MISFNLSVRLITTSMGRFYSTAWDPRLIISQIVLIQCAHYVLLGVFLWIMDGMAQRPLTMDQIFNYREIDFSPGGTVTTISFLLTSLVGSVAVVWAVERAKKVLDFSATVHIVHMLLTTLWAGFPVSWEWWLVHVLGVFTQTLLGEYLAFRLYEMHDIPLGNLVNL